MKERSEREREQRKWSHIRTRYSVCFQWSLTLFLLILFITREKDQGGTRGGKASRTIGEKRKPYVRCVIKLLYFQNALRIHGDLKFPLTSTTPQHKQASDSLVCFCRHKL